MRTLHMKSCWYSAIQTYIRLGLDIRYYYKRHLAETVFRLGVCAAEAELIDLVNTFIACWYSRTPDFEVAIQQQRDINQKPEYRLIWAGWILGYAALKLLCELKQKKCKELTLSEKGKKKKERKKKKEKNKPLQQLIE